MKIFCGQMKKMADLVDDDTLGGFGYDFEGGGSSKKEVIMVSNILMVVLLLCILWCCFNAMCALRGEGMLGNVLLPNQSRITDHTAVFGDPARNNARNYLGGKPEREISKGIEFNSEGLSSGMNQYLRTGNSADSYRTEKADSLRLTSQLYSGN